MIKCFSEHPSPNASSGLLRSRVVHLFEHAGNSQQIGRFEATQIGEQMLGSRKIADHSLPANRNILDVTGETVCQRQEQHQTIRLIQHFVENDVAVQHDMREVPVRQHGAFGLACGAGRIHNGEHVIGLDSGDHLIKRVLADALSEIGNGIETIRLEIENIT